MGRGQAPPTSRCAHVCAHPHVHPPTRGSRPLAEVRRRCGAVAGVVELAQALPTAGATLQLYCTAVCDAFFLVNSYLETGPAANMPMGD